MRSPEAVAHFLRLADIQDVFSFQAHRPTDEKERFALVGDICHAGEYASTDVVQVDVRGYEQRVGLLSGELFPHGAPASFQFVLQFDIIHGGRI